MKPNLEKLYDKTPDEALATLAAGAFFRADTDEMYRVVSTIGDRQPGAQLRYSHHQHGLTTTTLLWCLDCSSTYSQILEMRLAVEGGGLGEKAALFAKFMGRAMQGRLASLLDAMRQICDVSGLDFEDVQRMSGVSDMTFRDDVPGIPAAVAEFVEQYRMPASH